MFVQFLKTVTALTLQTIGLFQPSISKISEKLVYNRLTDYLTKCSILTNNQYGFRSKHDTSMAVIEMVDKMSEAIDKGYYFIGLLINLSKAFDTI